MFGIESLENRQFLSGSPLSVPNVSTDAGTASIHAKPSSGPRPHGHAVFTLNGSVLTVDNAIDVQISDFGDGSVVVTDKTYRTSVSQSFTGLTDVVVNGTSGADILTGGFETVNVTFNGGAGDDQYSVANNGVYSVVINDTVGINDIAGKNNSTGSFQIYTNAQSTLRISASPNPIDVFIS